MMPLVWYLMNNLTFKRLVNCHCERPASGGERGNLAFETVIALLLTLLAMTTKCKRSVRITTLEEMVSQSEM
jgi:hypothetical protein